ncbi:unnamed protein product, partial [Choristocarpus tenellus]
RGRGSRGGGGGGGGAGPGGGGAGIGGGGAGGSGYPWWQHIKNDSSRAKALTVAEMSPQQREAHLADKAHQKHQQRLADPEPEKLEVPEHMLTKVYYAARDVVLNSAGKLRTDNEGPKPRRREVFGMPEPPGGSSPPQPPPKGPMYEEIQASRRRLPAYAKSEEIVRTINENQVVVISGETGCGKTTQVPQFVMDQAL